MTPLGTPEPSTYALVIGISGFDNLGYLEGCVNDAVEFTNFLVDRVHIAPPNLRLLLAPAAEEPVSGLHPGLTVGDARTASILAVLEELTARVQPGDQVIIYFATHGARLKSPNESWVYILVPQDFPPPADLGGVGARWDRMISGAQLGHYLRALTKKASVSVISDTCHSADSMRRVRRRDPGRSIELPQPSAEQWRQFVAAHGSWADLTTAGPLPAAGVDRDWVYFAACREFQTAQMRRFANEQGTLVWHGLFTGKLLEQLRKTQVPVAELRWLDLQYAVRDAVLAATAYGEGDSEQTPVLTGRRESLIFGGKWTPFEPGYTVLVDAAGGLVVSAGLVHGLDEGAILEVFPPNTASFAEAVAQGVPMATVEILADPSPTWSRLRLLTGSLPADQSRARLRLASPKASPLSVRLPPEIAAADVLLAPHDSQRLKLVTGEAPADLAVHPWQYALGERRGQNRPVKLRDGVNHREGGWVLVESRAVRAAASELSADDVIAYLPPITKDHDEKAVARALRDGLIHWGNYQRLLHQHSQDQALQTCLQFKVLTGDYDQLLGVLQGRRAPDAQALDTVELTDDQCLLLQLDIKPWTVAGWKLSLGVLVFSHDGNVWALGPLADVEARWGELGSDEGTFLGAPTASGLPSPAVQRIYVGSSKGDPLSLTRRADQQRSRYTIKILVATARVGESAVAPDQLRLQPDVQHVIAESLQTTRGGEASHVVAAPRPLPLWYSWNIDVAVSRTSDSPADVADPAVLSQG